MLKILLATAVPFAFGLIPGPAAGAKPTPLDSCYQGAKARPDVSDCLEQRLRTAEAALERVSVAVHGNMSELDRVTGKPEGVPAFEESERAFRHYRDRHCDWVGAAAAGGSGSGDMIRDCMIRLTEQRTKELERRLPVHTVVPVPSSLAAQPDKPQTAGNLVARSDQAQTAADILPGEWRLTQFQRAGRSVPLPDKAQATLSFDRNGMAEGRSFINRYFGRAKVAPGGGLRWTAALGSTRMAGPPDLMAKEEDYLRALGRVSQWRMEGETLTLESENSAVVLRFTR